MQEIKVPLVSVTRSECDENHTHLIYYVGNTMILDIDILKDFVPSTGPVDDMILVQLLVTPHEHMSILADILAFAKAKQTVGPAWDDLISRVEQLLLPPR